MSLTSNGLYSPMNRFGFHKRVLMAYSPDFADSTKVDCYIPTRAEVFRMDATALIPMLEHWFSHAPAVLTPNREQKEAVIKLLKTRYDAESLNQEIDALEQLL